VTGEKSSELIEGYLMSIQKSQRFFICNLVKDVSFPIKKIRAHKHTWLEAIDFK
jgi:hypothetical protein